MSDIKTNEKYPKIIMDNIQNAVNSNMKAEISVELLNDILHHTHNLSDLLGSIDPDGGVSSEEGLAIMAKINEVQESLQATQDKVVEIKETVKNIEEGNLNGIYFEIET